MEDQKGTRAAIVAALTLYLEEERARRVSALPKPAFSRWKVFGREEIMRHRTPWLARQARAVRG